LLRVDLEALEALEDNEDPEHVVNNLLFSRLSSSSDRSYSKRVVDIPNVGFYSLPKIMGRTGRFIYDGLRLISLGCKQKQKNTNIVQKPNTALVAVGHFPLSP